MKKLLSILLIATMVVSAISYSSHKTKANIYVQDWADGKMNSIVYNWNKIKNITKYEIYRASSKNSNSKIVKKKYKKIKTIKNKNTKKYIDKKVKSNRYYCYYLKAYRGKKVIADSYDIDGINMVCKGISAPKLVNGGFWYDFQDDDYHFHLYAFDSKTGAKYFQTVKIWKKKKGDSKFKLVNLKKRAKLHQYYDPNVKKGQTYYYKAKGYYKKKNKKTKASMFSKTIEVYAGNYYGQYKVKTLTPTKKYENTTSLRTVLEISNTSIFNGKTILHRSDSISNCALYQATVKTNPGDNYYSKLHSYEAFITKYSYDNISWKEIPKEGIDLSNKTTYLEVIIRTNTVDPYYEEDANNIYYGGNGCDYETSYLDFKSLVDYHGPADAFTIFGFNLKTGGVQCYNYF